MGRTARYSTMSNMRVLNKLATTSTTPFHMLYAADVLNVPCFRITFASSGCKSTISKCQISLQATWPVKQHRSKKFAFQKLVEQNSKTSSPLIPFLFQNLHLQQLAGFISFLFQDPINFEAISRGKPVG